MAASGTLFSGLPELANQRIEKAGPEGRAGG